MKLLIENFPVSPVPWQRVTPFRGSARMITAEKTRVFQRTIGALARYKMGPRAPYDQPLVVALRFHISRGGKGRRPSHDVKPDLDNLSKSVLDAFNKIVWVDDARIVRLDSSKVWTDAPQGWFVLEVDTL